VWKTSRKIFKHCLVVHTMRGIRIVGHTQKLNNKTKFVSPSLFWFHWPLPLSFIYNLFSRLQDFRQRTQPNIGVLHIAPIELATIHCLQKSVLIFSRKFSHTPSRMRKSLSFVFGGLWFLKQRFQTDHYCERIPVKRKKVILVKYGGSAITL
jgi:hypothetical protein